MFVKKNDLKLLLAIAIPLILTELMESAVGFVNTAFLSHLGPDDLAAGSLVIWFFLTLVVVMWGVLTAISMLVSHADGQRDTYKIALLLRTSVIVAIILAIPSTMVIWHMAPILLWLGQSPLIVTQAIPYMHILAWSILPDFISLALLQVIIGLGHVRTHFCFIACWVPLNIIFSYTFTFGKLGLPVMHLSGVALGTSLAYWVTFLSLVLYIACRHHYRHYTRALFCLTQLYRQARQLLKLGIPIGLMWSMEMGFFFVLAILMGWHSLAALDANQITVQFVEIYSAMMFGLSQAITVRMSYLLSTKQMHAAKNTVYAGFIIALSLSMVTSFLFLFPQILLELDISAGHKTYVDVTFYADKFFSIAIIFVLFESLRMVIFGALRALNDVNFTLIITFISLWCFVIPLGLAMSTDETLGPSGFWWIFAIASFLSAVLLRFRYQVKQQIFRH